MREDLWIARRNALAACAYMGMSISEAAQDVGVTPHTVRTYAQKYGIKFSDGRTKRKLKTSVDAAQLSELADRGLSLKDAASSLGVSYTTAFRCAHTNNIKFSARAGWRHLDERNEAMAAMYRAGKTLQDIGVLYGLSRERVRQILKEQFGIEASEGGQSVRAKLISERRKANREAACLRRYGCSLEQLNGVKAIGRQMMDDGQSYFRTPMGAFVTQRRNAKARGIEWKLLFWEWWTIWQDSGHWENRGRGQGHVMCRFRDSGAYEVGNVYIATASHNSTVQPNNPYRKGHPDFEKVVTMARRETSRVCSIEGCQRKHYARGYCNNHYVTLVYRPRRHQKLEAAA